MRRGCRMGDQALGVAEIVADAHELERVLEAERCGLAPLDLEGDQRRAPMHLPTHDLGLRMVRPARIDQARDLWMLGERDRDGRRGVGLPAHAHAQRLQPLEQDPRVERGQRRAGLADQRVDVVLNDFFGAENDAAQESTAQSAPSASGRWTSGVENTWSAKGVAAAPWAISAITLMSSTSSAGLVGVSRKKVLVFGRTALRHCTRSVPSTSVEATP